MNLYLAIMVVLVTAAAVWLVVNIHCAPEQRNPDDGR